MESIKNHFLKARDILDRFISDSASFEKIGQAGELCVQAFRSGNKVLSCGNGGSMSDAMHFAEELSGRYRDDRRPFPAMAISDPSYLSCVANDYGYDEVFARAVSAFGQSGDVLLAISTSGNSANVLKAASVAREKDMRIIALTGKDGGKLALLSDLEIRSPFSEYADHAQEIHIKVIHSLIDYIERNV